jgi:hypothetical protein
MKIFEVDQSETGADPNKLLGLVNFLVGRAKDTNATKQISQDAFIDLAKNLNIPINKNNLAEIVSKPPLSNLLEPVEPNSDIIRFKGNTERTTGMTVDKAEDIVDANAKAAMRRMK